MNKQLTSTDKSSQDYHGKNTSDANSLSAAKDKARINYIDCVRGFSMFLVVFGHVLFQSIGLNEGESYLNMVLASFRMPMFFFVSGIVAYKPLSKWTYSYAGNILKRKFQAQIIGTIFFYTLLLLALHAENPFRAFKLEVGGYWFTLTLFRIFLLYAFLNLLLKRFSEQLIFVLLTIISAIGIYLFYTKSIHNFLFSLLGYNTLYFMQFFIIGLLLKKYGIDYIGKILKGNRIAIFTLCFILLSILSYSYENEVKAISGWLYYFICDEFLRYSGVILVFGLFYINRDKFNIENRANKIIILIGRRTLDIYFIHYFFLPDMHWLKGYIVGGSNAVVTQLIIGFVIASIIVGICLGISYILRLSPIFGEWVFGLKKQSYSNTH